MGEPWKQRKLENITLKYFGGGTPTTKISEYWQGDLPWFQSSDFIKGSIDAPKISKKVSENGLKNSAAKKIPGNSIAIITRVGVGKLGVIPFSYATSQDFLSLHLDSDNNLYFIAYQLQKILDTVNQQGSAIKGITKKELLDLSISLPSLEEQVLISNVLKLIDSIITLHQRNQQGSAIKGITKKELLDLSISLPSLEEQVLISNVLKLIDSIITLHQRKGKILFSKKMAYLQLIFNK